MIICKRLGIVSEKRFCVINVISNPQTNVTHVVEFKGKRMSPPLLPRKNVLFKTLVIFRSRKRAKSKWSIHII